MGVHPMKVIASVWLFMKKEMICAIRGLMRYGVPYKGSKNSIAEWVCCH